MDNLNGTLTVINLVGVVAIAGSMFYNNWRTSKDKIGSDVLALYKEQIAALEADVLRGRDKGHELGNQLQALTLQVGKLQGEIAARDKQINEYREIFQNRDPQLQEILREIRDFMVSLDAKTDRNERRNIMIDKNIADKRRKL